MEDRDHATHREGVADPGEGGEVELAEVDVLREEVRARHGLDRQLDARLLQRGLRDLRLEQSVRCLARNGDGDAERLAALREVGAALLPPVTGQQARCLARVYSMYCGSVIKTKTNVVELVG